MSLISHLIIVFLKINIFVSSLNLFVFPSAISSFGETRIRSGQSPGQHSEPVQVPESSSCPGPKEISQPERSGGGKLQNYSWPVSALNGPLQVLWSGSLTSRTPVQSEVQDWSQLQLVQNLSSVWVCFPGSFRTLTGQNQSLSDLKMLNLLKIRSIICFLCCNCEVLHSKSILTLKNINNSGKTASLMLTQSYKLKTL